MTSQDDIAALRVLYERGEINDEEYRLLLRHVLGGDPLPPAIVRRAALEPPRRIPPGPPVDRPRTPPPGHPIPPPLSGDPARHGRGPQDTGPRRPPGFDDRVFDPTRAEPREPERWEQAVRHDSYPRQRTPPVRPPAGEVVPWTNAAPPAGRPPTDPHRHRSDERPKPPARAPGRAAPGEAARSDGAAASGELERPERARLPELAAVRFPTRRPAVAAQAAPRGTKRARGAPGKTSGATRRTPADRPLPPPARRSPAGSRRRRRLTLLASAACVLALVGAGVRWFALRSSFVQPDVYAHRVCTTVSRWQGDLAQRREKLVTVIGGPASMDQVRDTLVAFYQDAETQTAKLSVDLAQIGSPNTQGGQNYAKSLRDAVASAASAFHDEAERSGGLDTSSKDVFRTTVQLRLSSLDEKTRPVLDALSARGSDPPLALRIAFDAEPTCAAYTG